MNTIRIPLFVSIFTLPLSAFGQQWHSLENQGMVVEETPPQAAISDLPASPDEVIVWSNEAAVLAELRQQYGSVTPSDSYVMPRGNTSESSTIEQRYTSRRPVLYMDTADASQWSTRNHASRPIEPHAPITSRAPFNTSRPIAVGPQGLPHNHQPTGVLPWIRELEYRKNLWLRRRFGQ